MPKQRLSNPLALAVLSSLLQRPMHPYEIATTMREQHHDTAVKLNYGSLYNMVETLYRDGFIEMAGVGREGNRPARTVYSITAQGRDELSRWLRELLSTPVEEYPRYIAGLAFMTGLAPEDASAQLALRAQRLDEEIRHAQRALQDALQGAGQREPVPKVYLVEDECRLALKQAELEWTRVLIQEIDNGTLDGLDEWRHHHRLAEDSHS